MAGMDRKDVEAKLAATEARRRAAEARLQENARRLQRLEEERSALLGDSTIAERSVADFESYQERLRAELAAIEVDEARASLSDAVRARDAALERAARTAAAVVAALDEVEGARTYVTETHHRLRSIDPTASADAPAEPTSFDEHWQIVAPMIERELGRRLESQMVEAAARSRNVTAIDDLPAHLREIARDRRRSLLRNPARTTE